MRVARVLLQLSSKDRSRSELPLANHYVDCRKSLFFSHVVRGMHALASVEPSRVFHHARGHFRVSRVSLDGLRKKESVLSLIVTCGYFLTSTSM